MKKRLLTILLSVAMFMSAPIQVYANLVPTVPNPSRFNTLEDIINTLGGLLRPVVIISLIAILMYGGWVRLSSQGNPDKISLSSKIIVSALVGFAIIVMAPVIVDFAGSLLGIQGGLVDLSSN